MRAELHFAGFQTHPFVARVARNWPQSNDGQSQHLCPAASCIINKCQAHWLWISGLFQETYFLTTCFSKYVISFPFHWEVITPSTQIFVLFFLRTRQEATLSSNMSLLSIHFTCQPSVKTLSWVSCSYCDLNIFHFCISRRRWRDMREMDMQLL